MGEETAKPTPAPTPTPSESGGASGGSEAKKGAPVAFRYPEGSGTTCIGTASIDERIAEEANMAECSHYKFEEREGGKGVLKDTTTGLCLDFFKIRGYWGSFTCNKYNANQLVGDHA